MKNEIWFYEKGYYKAFFKDYSIKHNIDQRIARTDLWKKVRLGCYYFLPDGRKAWDYIFPAKLYNKFAVLLSLPERKKHPNRVKSGMQVQKLKKRYDITKVNARKRPFKSIESSSIKLGKG